MKSGITERPPAVALLSVRIDRLSPEQIHDQLSSQIRQSILNGQLAPRTRLPSSSMLAAELGCARNTVVSVYEQLTSEGFLTGVKRLGTFVSSDFDPDLLATHIKQQPVSKQAREPVVSAYARALSRTYYSLGKTGRAFDLAGPDVSMFPFDVWGRLAGRIWAEPSGKLVRDRDSSGYLPLRKSIAEYLASSRGIVCSADQVLITSGATQAIDLILRLLLEPGHEAWVEEPGYMECIDKIRALGVHPCPVPVDSEGLIVAEGQVRSPKARLAFVTPSHQFPLGVIMTLGRRLELLAWARSADAWIIEDDYDGEFRYIGRPLPALKSLDRDGLVIYMGTFSKVLFDGLRLGYVVLPERLVEIFVRSRRHLDLWPPIMAQPVLAHFMAEGHFAAHVHRMRRAYAARRDALIAHAKQHLSGLLDFGGDEAGLHVTAHFKSDLARRLSEPEAIERAARLGVGTASLAQCYQDKPAHSGLILGYATVDESSIATGVRSLARALSSTRTS